MAPKPTCLSLLHSAALALPALANAAAAITEPEIYAGATRYDEDDLSSSERIFGATERYEVEAFQVGLNLPIGDEWLLQGNVIREIMSGASPQASVPGLGGDPVLIMSGATIDDDRNKFDVRATRYHDTWSWSLGFARSSEEDYKSNGYQAGVVLELADTLTLAVDASFAKDKIEPTDAIELNRVVEENRRTASGSVALTQVINRTTALQYGIGYTRHSGYLSDPYKSSDIRPETREEWTVSTRLRHFFESLKGALHLDYRYYDDSYGVEAHTLEMKWYQNLGFQWQLNPYVRYYSQDDADFFDYTNRFTFDPTQPESSDHRLAKFGSISGGVALVYQQPTWSAMVDVERYVADEKYGLFDGEFDHPAALGFTRVSVTWSMRF